MCNQDSQRDTERHADTEGSYYISPQIRRRLGEAIVLIVYVVGDAIEFWPAHHGWALILAVIGFSAVILIEFPIPHWLIATTILIALAFVGYLFSPPVLPPETETHGWLMPGNEATPVNGCTGRTLPANALLFIAGTNGAWTTSSGTTLLNVANTDVLSFQREKNGLLFDMDMYDKQGNLILRMEKNEFHLIPGTYSYPNRSHDRSQLIVYDKKGYVLFYIGYLNKNTVRIAGQFYGADGTEVLIDPYNVIEVNNKSEDTMNCAGNFSRAGFLFSRSNN